MASYLVETADGKKYQVDTEDQQTSPSTPAPVSAPSESTSPLDKIAEMGKKIAPSLGGAIGQSTGLGLMGELAGRAVQANPQAAVNQAPTAGMVAGGLVGGIPGAAAGGAAGEALKQVDTAALGNGTQKSPLDAISEMGKQAAIGAGGEALGAGVAKVAEKMAPPLAERALGLTKGILHNPNSYKGTLANLDRARQAASTFLDNGVLKVTTRGTSNELGKLFDSSGEVMNGVRNTLTKAGVSINKVDVLNALDSSISAQFPGEKTSLEILKKDVESLGDKVSLDDLQKLITRFSKQGWARNADESVDSVKISRQAADTLNGVMEDTITNSGGEVANKTYQEAKSLYGQGKFVARGLAQKLSAEQGNNVFSLPTYVLASGALGRAGLGPMAEALGAVQLSQRFGPAVAAKSAKALSKTAGPLVTGSLSEIIRKARGQ